MAAALLQHSYSRLELPLAIMTGDADAVVNGAEQSCRLHEEIAGSALTILPGQGHMIQYAAKGQIGRAVDGFMGLPRRSPT
jgi:pimeloyl-ACP methyl ester carboxylesterase